MIYPILAMVMAEKNVGLQDIEKQVMYTKSFTSRLLNGYFEMNEETKERIYRFLSLDYISKDQLFIKRGSTEIVSILYMMHLLELGKGEQDEHYDGGRGEGVEHAEPGNGLCGTA